MINLKYNKKNFKGDLMGGIVAGIVALPLALAFGVQSGLGAIAGLYGAVAVGIFAAIFGGTATQASGPTGPMTVVSASFITIAIAQSGNVDNAMGMIAATFLLAGIFQILFGLLRIGAYVRYFPYPVVSGFMTGVGLIIVLFQIFPLVGVPSVKSTIDVIQNLGTVFLNFNFDAVIIGLLTVIIFYVFPKITKSIPSTLVALVVATLIAYFFKLDVNLIGNIPSGLPNLHIEGILNISSSSYTTIIEFALILAALGSIDSLLTSVIADNMTKTKHNSNRELIGQGIGNAIAGLIGGIPGAGATKGTVVNINSGGTTRLSGTIHGLFLLFVLLGAGSLAAYIPIPVLAGLLIPVGINIIDWKALKHLKFIPKADAAVLIIVLLITTFGNLIYAVGIGLVLSCILFMKQSADIAQAASKLSTIGKDETAELWGDEKSVTESFKSKIYFLHLDGPLFFGFTSHFQKIIADISPSIKYLIIRMDWVPYIDQSGLYAMEDAVLQLSHKGVKILLIKVAEQPASILTSINIIPGLIPENQIFEDIKTVSFWLKEKENL